MRAQSTSTDDGYPTYTHSQLLVREVSKTVLLPLPLPLCRVLLLDSSSPVVSKWETERGDSGSRCWWKNCCAQRTNYVKQ